MDPENKKEEIEEGGKDIQMNNFSMVIAIVFVTLVMVFLFAKIMFD